MFIIGKIFSLIMGLDNSISGIAIKAIFIICYLLFLLYALRRYNFHTAPFGSMAEDFKKPFVVIAVISAIIAFLINMNWFNPVCFVLMLVTEIGLVIWCFREVSRYSDELSVIGNVCFWFITAVSAGQILMIYYTIIGIVIFVAVILIMLMVYVIVTEVGSL